MEEEDRHRETLYSNHYFYFQYFKYTLVIMLTYFLLDAVFLLVPRVFFTVLY